MAGDGLFRRCASSSTSWARRSLASRPPLRSRCRISPSKASPLSITPQDARLQPPPEVRLRRRRQRRRAPPSHLLHRRARPHQRALRHAEAVVRRRACQVRLQPPQARRAGGTVVHARQHAGAAHQDDEELSGACARALLAVGGAGVSAAPRCLRRGLPRRRLQDRSAMRAGAPGHRGQQDPALQQVQRRPRDALRMGCRSAVNIMLPCFASSSSLARATKLIFFSVLSFLISRSSLYIP